MKPICDWKATVSICLAFFLFANLSYGSKHNNINYKDDDYSLNDLHLSLATFDLSELQQNHHLKFDTTRKSVIKSCLLETSSPTIKDLSSFIDQTMAYNEYRWGMSVGWKSILLNSDYNYQTKDNPVSSCKFMFIETAFEVFLKLLMSEAKSNILKNSDYKFLIISGFGDYVVEMLQELPQLHSSIIDLVEIAGEFEEESFLVSLCGKVFSRKECSYKTELQSLMGKEPFWYHIAIAHVPQIFNEVTKYLNGVQLKTLNSMLESYIKDHPNTSESFNLEFNTISKLLHTSAPVLSFTEDFSNN